MSASYNSTKNSQKLSIKKNDNFSKTKDSNFKFDNDAQFDKAEKLFRNPKIQLYSQEDFPNEMEEGKESGEGKEKGSKEYIINFDKKNKLKPSCPVQKSIEIPFKTPTNQDLQKNVSKTRFSKNADLKVNSLKNSTNYINVFESRPEQLEKIDINFENQKQNFGLNKPNSYANPSYATPERYITNRTQESKTNSYFPEEKNESQHFKNEIMNRQIKRNMSNNSLNQNHQNMYGFAPKLLSPSKPMHKSNLYSNNHKKTNIKNRFNTNSSIEKKKINPQRNPQEIFTRNKNTMQSMKNQSGLSGTSGRGQGEGAYLEMKHRYQTISHPQGMGRNNSMNQHSSKYSHTRKKTHQFSTKKGIESQHIPENLSRSHARFKMFEENLEQYPVKNINTLINPSHHKYTQNEVIQTEFLGNKKTTLDLIMDKKNYNQRSKKKQMKQYSQLDKMSQRSKNMSDKFSKQYNKTRSTRNTHYNKKKNDFLKNAQTHRKTMKHPPQGHFIPQNNLNSIKNHPYKKMPTTRNTGINNQQFMRPDSKVKISNYSKRTHSKQMNQLHKKMNKHRSVSNLHYGTNKYKKKPGSTRNLNSSQVSQNNFQN